MQIRRWSLQISPEYEACTSEPGNAKRDSDGPTWVCINPLFLRMPCDSTKTMIAAEFISFRPVNAWIYVDHNTISRTYITWRVRSRTWAVQLFPSGIFAHREISDLKFRTSFSRPEIGGPTRMSMSEIQKTKNKQCSPRRTVGVWSCRSSRSSDRGGHLDGYVRDRTNNGGETASARGEGYRGEYGMNACEPEWTRIGASRPRKAYTGMVGCTGMMSMRRNWMKSMAIMLQILELSYSKYHIT